MSSLAFLGKLLRFARGSPQLIDRDLSQESAKGAGPLPIESRQLAHQDEHDILSDTIGVRHQTWIALDHRLDKGPIYRKQFLPIGVVPIVGNSIEQAE